jgi:hypothetical protein
MFGQEKPEAAARTSSRPFNLYASPLHIVPPASLSKLNVRGNIFFSNKCSKLSSPGFNNNPPVGYY